MDPNSSDESSGDPIRLPGLKSLSIDELSKDTTSVPPPPGTTPIPQSPPHPPTATEMYLSQRASGPEHGDLVLSNLAENSVFLLGGLQGPSLEELRKHTTSVPPPVWFVPVPRCAPIPHEVLVIDFKENTEEAEIATAVIEAHSETHIPTSMETVSISHSARLPPIEIAPRMFALIVGIDEYRSIRPNPPGCVDDAMAVRDYLIECRDVPEDRILLLINEQATRQNIIDAFLEHLINNKQIRDSEEDGDGDAMIFYFAGYGSCALVKRWLTDVRKVETICPYDETMEHEDRPEVPGIPDRTLWALHHALALAKGNNITTILDCSHYGVAKPGDSLEAGGVHLSDRDYPILPRSHGVSIAIDNELDKPIWSKFMPQGVPADYPRDFQYSNMSSHVLLAACQRSEQAFSVKLKIDGISRLRGAFTYALVDVLRNKITNRTTYVDAIDMLKLRYQHPHCEGTNKQCPLFTVNENRIKFFPVHSDDKGDVKVRAGNMHGVVVGTLFELCDQRRSSKGVLGSFRAIAVDDYSANLALVPSSSVEMLKIPSSSYARVVAWGNPDAKLSVYLHLRGSSQLSDLVSLLSPNKVRPADRTRASGEASFEIITTHNKHAADIILYDLPDGRVEIRRSDSYIDGVPRMDTIISDRTSILNRVLFILHSAAHFKFHFLRNNTNANSVSGGVSMKLCKRASHVNLLKKGKAQLTAGEGRYGVALHNQSQEYLFPFLFCFNPSNYYIHRWYIPPANATHPPLRRNSIFAIGWDDYDSFNSIKFTLKEGEKSDINLFKLFLSSENSDMEHIEQRNPFEGNAPDMLGILKHDAEHIDQRNPLEGNSPDMLGIFKQKTWAEDGPKSWGSLSAIVEVRQEPVGFLDRVARTFQR